MSSKSIVAETGSGKTAEILFNVLKSASTNAVTSELNNAKPEKPSNVLSTKTDK